VLDIVALQGVSWLLHQAAQVQQPGQVGAEPRQQADDTGRAGQAGQPWSQVGTTLVGGASSSHWANWFEDLLHQWRIIGRACKPEHGLPPVDSMLEALIDAAVLVAVVEIHVC
jgi:hypothetical protein